jgi:iron complex outermembrane recepter protein
VVLLELALLNKYVSRQYLDNTTNLSRSIDPYFITDFRLSFTIKPKGSIQEIGIYDLVNNLFNTMYSSNGYTYSYIYGDLITENFLYPQAGINFLGGVSFRF